MILVWNTTTDVWYSFPSIEAYTEFAIKNEGSSRTALDDILWDVGEGGEATDENQIRVKRAWLNALGVNNEAP